MISQNEKWEGSDQVGNQMVILCVSHKSMLEMVLIKHQASKDSVNSYCVGRHRMIKLPVI